MIFHMHMMISLGVKLSVRNRENQEFSINPRECFFFFLDIKDIAFLGHF